MSSASGGAAAAASSLSMRSTLSVSNKHLASCDLVLSKLKNSDLDKAMLLLLKKEEEKLPSYLVARIKAACHILAAEKEKDRSKRVDALKAAKDACAGSAKQHLLAYYLHLYADLHLKHATLASLDVRQKLAVFLDAKKVFTEFHNLVTNPSDFLSEQVEVAKHERCLLHLSSDTGKVLVFHLVSAVEAMFKTLSAMCQSGSKTEEVALLTDAPEFMPRLQEVRQHVEKQIAQREATTKSLQREARHEAASGTASQIAAATRASLKAKLAVTHAKVELKNTAAQLTALEHSHKDDETIRTYVRARLADGVSPQQLVEELLAPLCAGDVRQHFTKGKEYSADFKAALLDALQKLCTQVHTPEPLMYTFSIDVDADGKPARGKPASRRYHAEMTRKRLHKLCTDRVFKPEEIKPLFLWTAAAAFADGAVDSSQEQAAGDSDDKDQLVSAEWVDLFVGDDKDVMTTFNALENLPDDGVFDSPLGQARGSMWGSQGTRRDRAEKVLGDPDARALLLLRCRLVHPDSARSKYLLKMIDGAKRAGDEGKLHWLRAVTQFAPTATTLLSARARHTHCSRVDEFQGFDDAVLAGTWYQSDHGDLPTASAQCDDPGAHDAHAMEQLPGDLTPRVAAYVRLDSSDAQRAATPFVACFADSGTLESRKGDNCIAAFELFSSFPERTQREVEKYMRDALVETPSAFSEDVPSWDPRFRAGDAGHHVDWIAHDSDFCGNLVALLYGAERMSAEELEALDGTSQGFALLKHIQRDVLLALRTLCTDSLLSIRTVVGIKRFVVRCLGLPFSRRPLHVSLLKLRPTQAVALAHFVRGWWDRCVYYTRAWMLVEEQATERMHSSLQVLQPHCGHQQPAGIAASSDTEILNQDDLLIHIPAIALMAPGADFGRESESAGSSITASHIHESQLASILNAVLSEALLSEIDDDAQRLLDDVNRKKLDLVFAQGDSFRATVEALDRLDRNIRHFAHFLVLCENNARTYEHNGGRLRCERLCEEVRQAQAFLLNNARRCALHELGVQNEERKSWQTRAVNDVDDGGMASATAAKTDDEFVGLFAENLSNISRISGILEELAQKQFSDDEASPTLVLGQALAELDALSAFAETCFCKVLDSARDFMAECPRQRSPHDELLKCCLLPLRSRWLAVAESYVKEMQNKVAEAAARELVEGDEASASKKAAATALRGVGGGAEGGDDEAKRAKAAAKEKKKAGEQRKREEASTCASEAAAAAAAAAAADDAKRKAELEAKRAKEEEEYDAMLARRAQEIADKEAEQERRRRQEFKEEKRRKEEEKKREEEELKVALKRSKDDAKRAEKQRREQEKKQAALDAAAAEAQASQPPSQEGVRPQRPAPANDAAIEARMQAQHNIFGDDASRMGLSAGARGVPPARPQPYRPPGAPGSMVTPSALPATDPANVTSFGDSGTAAGGVTGMPPFWLNTGASVLPSQPSPLPWLTPPAPPAQPMSSFLPPAPPSAIVAPSAPSAATEGGAAAGTGLSNATGVQLLPE